MIGSEEANAPEKLLGMRWLLKQLQLSGKMDALWAVRNDREDQACWHEFDRELNSFLDKEDPRT